MRQSALVPDPAVSGAMAQPPIRAARVNEIDVMPRQSIGKSAGRITTSRQPYSSSRRCASVERAIEVLAGIDHDSGTSAGTCVALGTDDDDLSLLSVAEPAADKTAAQHRAHELQACRRWQSVGKPRLTVHPLLDGDRARRRRACRPGVGASIGRASSSSYGHHTHAGGFQLDRSEQSEQVVVGPAPLGPIACIQT